MILGPILFYNPDFPEVPWSGPSSSALDTVTPSCHSNTQCATVLLAGHLLLCQAISDHLHLSSQGTQQTGPMPGSFSTVYHTRFLQGLLRTVHVLFEKGYHCHTSLSAKTRGPSHRAPTNIHVLSGTLGNSPLPCLFGVAHTSSLLAGQVPCCFSRGPGDSPAEQERLSFHHHCSS